MQELSNQETKLHLNSKQLMMYTVFAQRMVAIMARAMGKTYGIQAPFAIECIHRMPRSRGNFVGCSFVQIIDNLLPEMIKSWEKFGYKENEHFWVRKKPPKNIKIDKPFLPIVDYDHAIPWYNGTAINLISFDKNATLNNGKSSSWSMIDEARLINKQKLDERLILTMRGDRDYFGDLSCFMAALYTSDRPKTSKEMWLLDFHKQMDVDVINAIKLAQNRAFQIRGELRGILTNQKKHWLEKELIELEVSLNILRKGTTFVEYASTIDNIHALGMDVIENFINTLSPIELLVSVLNKQIINIDMCFYPLIDEDDIYDNYDYSYIESKQPGTIRDCRYDADLQISKPITIHMDYGFIFNCIVCAQTTGKDTLIINAFHGEGQKGETTEDVVNKFCEYYKQHKAKMVNYVYDHTAKQHSGVSRDSYRDVVFRTLKKNGWEVKEVYLGQTVEQADRFKIIGEMIRKSNTRFQPIKWNRERTDDVRIAMQQAPVKRSGEDYKKDKSSEDPKKGTEQRHATHYTDALDGLLIGMNLQHIRPNSTFIPTAVG